MFGDWGDPWGGLGDDEELRVGQDGWGELLMVDVAWGYTVNQFCNFCFNTFAIWLEMLNPITHTVLMSNPFTRANINQEILAFTHRLDIKIALKYTLWLIVYPPKRVSNCLWRILSNFSLTQSPNLYSLFFGRFVLFVPSSLLDQLMFLELNFVVTTQYPWEVLRRQLCLLCLPFFK